MGKRLLYINLDGFGKYYYDQMADREELKGINRLKKNGSFFEQAYTGIPSITYPMQSAIVSGCYSEKTGNCDKIWDRSSNQVVLLRRLNRAETIGEVLEKERVTTVSIQQFTLENRGCRRDDPEHLYVQPGGDYKKRFEILERLITDQEIETENGKMVYEKLPDAIFLYVDDLDTIGHNPEFCRTDVEEKRVHNVQQRLREIDAEIHRLLELLERKKLLEETYLLLTTDHGMISCTEDRTVQLKEALERYGFEKVCCCWEGDVPEKTEVLLTGHGIQCQIYLPKTFGKKQRMELKAYLQTFDFAESVLTKEELVEKGVCEEYADILISPKEGMGFAFGGMEKGKLYASHDSVNEKCQHIFAILAGPDVRKGYIEPRRVKNIDFIPSLAERMGWRRPENAVGRLPESVFVCERQEVTACDDKGGKRND